MNFPLFWRRQYFRDLRKCLMKNLPRIGSYDNKPNTSMILPSIKFIYSTKDFDGKLKCDVRLKTSSFLHCLDFSVCLIISMNQITRYCFLVFKCTMYFLFFLT